MLEVRSSFYHQMKITLLTGLNTKVEQAHRVELSCQSHREELKALIARPIRAPQKGLNYLACNFQKHIYIFKRFKASSAKYHHRR